MNNPNVHRWLSLGDVAALLGVHPSTVRAWSDQGVLPVYRTKGGHRRYRQSEIELWTQTSREHNQVKPEHALQRALRNIRFQIGEQSLAAESWYQKLDDDARQQYRMSGKVLMQGLASYLASEGEEAIAEARSLGYEYASRGRRYGFNTVDATSAFLFFRNLLLDAMITVYRDAHVSDAEAWQEMFMRIHSFTDQVMLSLLETFQAFEDNHR
ncbi:MAG: helix-turn-helix domain-containing protein [Anaerolineales bacterium]|nr:helix-turn-helix domain-containing protein [Anaerolineales bacterium]